MIYTAVVAAVNIAFYLPCSLFSMLWSSSPSSAAELTPLTGSPPFSPLSSLSPHHCYVIFYGLSMNGNERVLFKEVQTGGNVYCQAEKFGKVKLGKSWYATSGVVLWCCVVWVCDLSIWAPSRRSVLPHRLHCHNKITGGLLDSSFPQGFLLTFFFFSKFEAKHFLLCHKVWRGKFGEAE